MTEPLTAADLERMRAEHVEREQDEHSVCAECMFSEYENVDWPCDAARLLAELERRVQVHVAYNVYRRDPLTYATADIGRALCGPSTSEELEQ